MLSRIFFFILPVVFVSLGGEAKCEILDRVVASVEGSPVTELEVLKELGKISPGHNSTLPLSKENLKLGLTGILLDREAAQLGISVSEEDIDQQINYVMQRNNFSKEQFEESLSSAGMTVDQYKQKLTSELNRNRVISTALKYRVQVSNEELRTYLASSNDESSKELDSESDKFGLLKIILVDSDFNEEEESKSITELLKNGGECETYSSADIKKCLNLGIFEEADLREDFAKALDDVDDMKFSKVLNDNEDFVLMKTEPSLLRKLTSIQKDIKDRLLQEKFKVEAEKYLENELFEKFLVETHF